MLSCGCGCEGVAAAAAAAAAAIAGIGCSMCQKLWRVLFWDAGAWSGAEGGWWACSRC